MQQGTVKSFDPRTKVAVVLTDQRVEYVVPGEVFARSGLRLLTLGPVSYTHLTLPTIYSV